MPGGQDGGGSDDDGGERGDEALAAVVADVFGAVSAGEDVGILRTLGPVYRSTGPGADAGVDARDGVVRSALGDDAADHPSVLVLACGAGGLLERLAGRYDRVLGVEADGRIAGIASRRAGVPVVVGDPTGPPLRGSFDAVVALGYPTVRPAAEDDPDLLFGTVRDLLAPGGTLVLDAPREPRAVLGDRWSGAVGGYRVERSVAAGNVSGDRAEMAIEYELERTGDGEVVEAVEHATVRLFDPDDLADALSSAGFVDVRVDANDDEPGGLVAVGRRPG